MQRILERAAARENRRELYETLAGRAGLDLQPRASWLLYRLAESPHASGFVLKGATLFALWTSDPHRATVPALGKCSSALRQFSPSLSSR